eukprot:Skav228666  [mRNA]  locus=scaffold1332:48470:49588:- [translate_table: standard]
MDDRSFWAKDAQALQSHIDSWSQFSAQVGFLENQAKTQVTSAQAEIKFLGVVTARQRRQMHEAENDRLSQATARANKLRALPLMLDQLLPAAKALVVSKAAYGWVARMPTQTASKKLFTALTKYGPQRMASPFVRRIVYGCKAHLEGVLLQRLWNRAVRLQSAGALVICNKAGSTWHLLTNQLQQCGWVKTRGQQVWKHPDIQAEGCVHSECTLRLEKDSMPAALHALRHSWRRAQFLDWLHNSQRHEAEEFVQLYTQEELLLAFHQVSWKRVRQALSWGPAYRGVLLGSVVSDAWLGRNSNQTCSLCNAAVGDLRHLFWDCPETRSTRPNDYVPPLQARLGWPSDAANLEVLHHQAAATSLLWQRRFGADG